MIELNYLTEQLFIKAFKVVKELIDTLNNQSVGNNKFFGFRVNANDKTKKKQHTYLVSKLLKYHLGIYT